MRGMLILGLDLGTHTGYALDEFRKHTILTWHSGTWDCSIKVGHDSPSLRFEKFKAHLRDLLTIGVDRVFYENVRAHKGVQAAHIYGALKAAMMEVCDEFGVPYQALEVGQVKRTMTGKGNASKARVIEACQQNGYDPRTEDEADAIAICLTGRTTLL